MTAAQPVPNLAAEADSANPSRVFKLRSYSSVFFLYPTLAMAALSGIIFGFGERTPDEPGTVGLVFTLFFFVNLTILAFDYTKKATITVGLTSIIVGLLAGISPLIADMISGMFNKPLFMNGSFYWLWTLLLLMFMGVAYGLSRLEHWTINGTDLVRHRVMQQGERFSVAELTVYVEIKDVAEYALLRSGNIVIYEGEGPPLVRFENVPNVKKVEARLQARLAQARYALPLHEIITEEELYDEVPEAPSVSDDAQASDRRPAATTISSSSSSVSSSAPSSAPSLSSSALVPPDLSAPPPSGSEPS